MVDPSVGVSLRAFTSAGGRYKPGYALADRAGVEGVIFFK